MRHWLLGQAAALIFLTALPASATTIGIVGGSSAVLSPGPEVDVPAPLVETWTGYLAGGATLATFDFFTGEAQFNDSVNAPPDSQLELVDDGTIARALAPTSTPVTPDTPETADQRPDMFANCTSISSAPGTFCDLAFVLRANRTGVGLAPATEMSRPPARTSLALVVVAIAAGGVVLVGGLVLLGDSAAARRRRRRWRVFRSKLLNSL